MVYVALLRGINVGGKTRVEMFRLKKTFESLGCHEVRTYINSGNVIFKDTRSADKLVPLIEKAIANEFALDMPVLLRSRENVQRLVEEIPAAWQNDSLQKTDVMFLWREIDSSSILDKIVINPELENVLYVDGALVWNIARENVTRGNGIKLIKTDLYRHMTIRNINTVRKLAELMATTGQGS
jgi:uncharacterized protein (DUF1697 family)